MRHDISRRSFLRNSGAATLAAAGAALGASSAARRADSPLPNADDTFGLLKQGKKIPVVFDTDNGGDIDDTLARTMLAKSPELDVKLVL